MQSPKYSAFSAYNPPHPAGLKQTQPYSGHPPYNNPVTVQNPGKKKLLKNNVFLKGGNFYRSPKKIFANFYSIINK